MKTNNIMLHTSVKFASAIILVFSIYLFFAGHNDPGGGFIGGLMTASALVLLNLSFGTETMKKVVPFNYVWFIGFGLSLCLGTGLASILLGDAFLTQYFDSFQMPILGEVELASSSIFALGVYFTVIGVVMVSILTIGEDH